MRPAGLNDKANCVVVFWDNSGGFLVLDAIGKQNTASSGTYSIKKLTTELMFDIIKVSLH